MDVCVSKSSSDEAVYVYSCLGRKERIPARHLLKYTACRESGRFQKFQGRREFANTL